MQVGHLDDATENADHGEPVVSQQTVGEDVYLVDDDNISTC